METIYVWIDDSIRPGHPVTRGVCPEHPEIDVSSSDDPDQVELKAYVMESWNRNFPDEYRRPEDFDYVARPEGWVEPNV